MNKKKIFATFAIIILLIMSVPVPKQQKNGDLVYKAVLYKYTKIHRPSDNSSTGYEDGWSLEILGRHVAGVTNITVETSQIEVVKKEIQDDNKYNIYLEREGRIIYLSSNLEEIYYQHGNNKETLKDYISNTWQTLDDSIKHLTDIMDNTGTIKDGGTQIYKSKKYDTTIIKCNTLLGNKDIFIGDYNMSLDNEIMCKREVN